jgi:hypothetical protein
MGFITRLVTVDTGTAGCRGEPPGEGCRIHENITSCKYHSVTVTHQYGFVTVASRHNLSSHLCTCHYLQVLRTAVSIGLLAGLWRFSS